MVKESKFGGRVVLLTAGALILLALALPMPWFDITVDNNYDPAPPFSPSATSEVYQFYIDHYFEDRSYADYPEHYAPYSDAAWDYPAMHTLMNRMEFFISLWILGGFALMGATLMNAKGESIVAGAFTVLMGVVAVVLFIATVGPALSAVPNFPATVGFYGAESGIASGVYSWNMKFGPSLGFGTIVLALILQTIAASLRTYVAWRDLNREGVWVQGNDVDTPEKV